MNGTLKNQGLPGSWDNAELGGKAEVVMRAGGCECDRKWKIEAGADGDDPGCLLLSVTAGI